MALFFDLSIPYLESSGAGGPAPSPAEARVLKESRLKAVVRAMELGYTGVAYDRRFRAGAVLSDAERCKIAPFPLSSLLAAAPALAASAALHRQLIGAPRSAPFRQYSRLTVAAAGAAAVAALNGNAVARTYDIVAVRPLNQEAFDKACECSEVDLIAVDFSQKLPFRFKLSLVKLAIKRGIHFEITYSHLIADVHLRRQILSDAKLLVDWTRGKNLIISSAASSVNDIRGPHDIANLATCLLGFSTERAKAAISRNCRSLIARTLRKKHFYKEAIKIERVMPDDQLASENSQFTDWKSWDPISSGDGDLPSLDDIAKMFSSASKPAVNLNSVDFTSACKTSFRLSQDVAITSPSKTEVTSVNINHFSPALDTGNEHVVFNKDEVMCEENLPVLSLQEEKVLTEEVLVLSCVEETLSVFGPNVAVTSSAKTTEPCTDMCEDHSSALSNGTQHTSFHDNQLTCEYDTVLQPENVLTEDLLVLPRNMEPMCADTEESDQVVNNESPKCAPDSFMTASSLEGCSSTYTDVGAVDNIASLGASPTPMVDLSSFSPSVAAEDIKQSVITEPSKDVAEFRNASPSVSAGHILMDNNMEQIRITAINLGPKGEYEDLDTMTSNEKGVTLLSEDVAFRDAFQENEKVGEFLNIKSDISMKEDKVTVTDDIHIPKFFNIRNDLSMKEDKIIAEDRVTVTDDIHMQVFLNIQNDLSMKEDGVIVKGDVHMPTADDGDASYDPKLGGGRCRDRLLRPAYPLPFRNLFKPQFFRKRLLRQKRKGKYM